MYHKFDEVVPGGGLTAPASGYRTLAGISERECLSYGWRSYDSAKTENLFETLQQQVYMHKSSKVGGIPGYFDRAIDNQKNRYSRPGYLSSAECENAKLADATSCFCLFRTSPRGYTSVTSKGLRIC